MIGWLPGETARRLGDAPALMDEQGRTLSHRALHRGAAAVAAGPLGSLVGPGEVVALILPSSLEYFVLYLGIARLGAVTAGVNPRLGAPERAALVDLAGARVAITTPKLAEGLPADLEILTVDQATGGDPEAAPAPLPPDPERLVALVFTSGTTGRPKAARFRERHLQAVMDIDLGPNPAWGGGPPMLVSTHPAHVGVMTKLPWYLRSGTTLHLLPRWRADDALRTISEHGIPTIGAVAPQLALMLRSPLLEELDLSCVRAIIAGGAASPPGLVQAARNAFGAAYSIRYSSTESGGVGLGTAFDAPEEEALHTIGRPRPGVEARVADEEGRPVPDGTVGELQLRSPAMMDGYHGDDAASAAAFTADGRLRTGDLALVDDAGCFRLSGRRSDMFIRGGYNVFPTEVEAALADHPAVAEVAVAPRPDEVMGEVGVAVVVLRPGAEAPTLEDLRAHAAARIAHFKLPEGLAVATSIPRTTMDKVDRAALARLVGTEPTR